MSESSERSARTGTGALAGARVILIAGTTASGKSATALALAARQPSVILNADALQVYAAAPILTAQPSAAERAAAPHALYGFRPAEAPYSVALWLHDIKVELAAAAQASKVAIIVGGTGLYFRALEQGLAPVPEIDPELRRRLREDTSPSGDLHAQLAAFDPSGAAALKPGDRQRVVRALEVVQSTGRPLAQWLSGPPGGSSLTGADVQRIVRLPPRAQNYAGAEARFAAMLDAGAAQEAAGLAHLPRQLPLMRAVGLAELAAAARGEISLDTAIEQACQHTRNYIKRQTTWLKRNMIANDWLLLE